MSLLTAHQGLRGLALAAISEWATILILIFGGCCSNALTLEQLTRAHPHSGSLITFAQFLSIAIHGFPKFVTVSPPDGRPGPRRWLPRLKKRKIPLAPYIVQVGLFYAISLLNNKAFGYRIPMPVHIIFRSGGLVVSMVMGWAFAGKRYSKTQIVSVLLVTAGVVLTTLSASKPKVARSSSSSFSAQDIAASTSQYVTGIAILSVALVFAGALGLVQDWTYSRYTRDPQLPSAHTAGSSSGHVKEEAAKTNANGKPAVLPTESSPELKQKSEDEILPWQESMFYLHFLSLPMFYFVRDDLSTQLSALRASPPVPLSFPSSMSTAVTSFLAFPSPSAMPVLHPPFGLEQPLALPSLSSLFEHGLQIPSGYVALALTTLTSMVCVSGVNRLTVRVSSLTVTLVLVVRKAVSMVVSVALFGARDADGKREMDAEMMWAGAALVFLGTMGYAAGSRGKGKAEKKGKKARTKED